MSESTPTKRIIFEPPSKDAPGFLRRNKQAMVFNVRLAGLQKKPANEWSMEDTSLFDEMIDFLVPYIKEPADPEEAREALWDASENDFSRMLGAVQGSGDGTEENPTKEAGSSSKNSASTSEE